MVQTLAWIPIGPSGLHRVLRQGTSVTLPLGTRVFIAPSFPLSILAQFLCPPLPAPGGGKHSDVVSGAASTHATIISVPLLPHDSWESPQRLPFPGSYTVSGLQRPFNPVLPNSEGVMSSLFCAGLWRGQCNTLSSVSTLPHILYHCCPLLPAFSVSLSLWRGG